jgi:ABC-2 type transport system ATP-binding protein
VIEIVNLTKRYGPVAAVDGLSFTAAPGRITGFLGANGSGKTTTLRVLLGLAQPTSGAAHIDGRPYRSLAQPARDVGAVLEQGIAHPGQSGRAHLRIQAMLIGAAWRRVDEVLAAVGLADAGNRRVGGYSLGMRQRLAVATALLGEPRVLVLDEPANGLDPEGIAWLRGLLRNQAAAGRTVLISSHLLAELAQTVDDVVVIARGRLVRQAPLAELTRGTAQSVRVRAQRPESLAQALRGRGASVTVDGDRMTVSGLGAEEIGYAAAAAQLVLFELTPVTVELEQAFLDLVGAT